MTEGHVTIPEAEERTFFGLRGRKISGDPADQGSVGVVGLTATAKRLNAARRFFPELSVEPLGDLCVDEDGTLYRIARFNPLLTERPGEQDVAGFTVAGDDSLLFLQKSSNPATVLELEQQQIEHGRNAAANAKAHAEFLADQPQLVPLLPGAHCELRESVKAITDHGGKIAVGAFGEVNVSLPAGCSTATTPSKARAKSRYARDSTRTSRPSSAAGASCSPHSTAAQRNPYTNASPPAIQPREEASAMDRETANELYGYESRRSGPGLDRRLAALGISPRSYSERKERERSGEVRGDIPTPRPSPSSPHLNYPTGGGISR